MKIIQQIGLNEMNLQNRINKNKESLDGLYKLDNLLYLYLAITPKLRLNDFQLKIRLKTIQKCFEYKKEKFEELFEMFKSTFEREKFKSIVKIELWELYSESIKIINNPEILKQIKQFINDYVSHIEKNNFYNISMFESFLNQMLVKVKRTNKYLKKMVLY